MAVGVPRFEANGGSFGWDPHRLPAERVLARARDGWWRGTQAPPDGIRRPRIQQLEPAPQGLWGRARLGGGRDPSGRRGEGGRSEGVWR